MARPKVALALGSGSARGWSHIGVIEALADAGIEPDIVCGASIGALVGAAWVTGRLDRLRAWVETAGWRHIAGLVDVSLSSGGLIETTKIGAFLRDLGIDAEIEFCARPYAAVATDMASGREVWLRRGAIDQAVRASIALPGIFSPVLHEGRWLLDGGLVNPVPVSACRALGAEIIIAVNLNGDLLQRRADELSAVPDDSQADTQADVQADTGPGISPGGIGLSADALAWVMKRVPKSLREQTTLIAPKLLSANHKAPAYFDVMAKAIHIMQDQITRSRLAGEPPHIMLMPRLPGIGLMEFHRGREAIAEGRACAERALPAIRQYLA